MVDQRAPQALRHLIDIFQSERDWNSAIDNAQRFEEVTGTPMGELIAMFECELAERHRAAGDIEAARAAMRRHLVASHRRYQRLLQIHAAQKETA